MKKQKQIKNKRKVPWKLVSVILLLLAILGLIIGFSIDWSRPSWIFISGSSTMQPLLQVISNNYKPSEITADAGGSSVGIQNVLNDKKNIGAASKTPSSSMAGVPSHEENEAIPGSEQSKWQNEKMKTVTIGWDGIGVVYKKTGVLADKSSQNGDDSISSSIQENDIVLTPNSIKWLYLAFAGYMDVDIRNLMWSNNQDSSINAKQVYEAKPATSPLSEYSIVPFARSGGTTQSGTAEAFTTDSRLLKDGNQYNSKKVLSGILSNTTNPTTVKNDDSTIDSPSKSDNATLWEVLESGQYGSLTHTTAESNLQTWTAIKSYNGVGIPMTYLSAGFIKNNYTDIVNAGFGVAWYKGDDNSQPVPLITKKDGQYSNDNVSQSYMWFRPLNLILKANSEAYIQRFIEWLIGNSLFKNSQYSKVLDEQGFIPIKKDQIKTMFINNQASVIDDIVEYEKQNPNSDYDSFIKNKSELEITEMWSSFWNDSDDYQLIDSNEYNNRKEQQVWYGAIPKVNNNTSSDDK